MPNKLVCIKITDEKIVHFAVHFNKLFIMSNNGWVCFFVRSSYSGNSFMMFYVITF